MGGGVKTFDAYKQEFFDMLALLMQTIQEYSGYANMSGWSTKGFLACPNCHNDTCFERLCHEKKVVLHGPL